jgi:hypothetical protein
MTDHNDAIERTQEKINQALNDGKTIWCPTCAAILSDLVHGTRDG